MEEKPDLILGSVNLGEGNLTADTFYFGIVLIILLLAYLSITSAKDKLRRKDDK